MSDPTVQTNWQLPSDDGLPLYGNTHLPADGVRPVGVLVCCHGFKGYKDYGFFPRLADDAARAGLIAHRFNFAHSGVTHEHETFGTPELFEGDTWSRQVADIGTVLMAVRNDELPGTGLPIVLFGHSRGGLASILAAAQDKEAGGELAGLVSASAPADALRMPDDALAALLRDGRLAIESARTGQTLHIGKAFAEEVLADPDAFDPVQRIAAYPGHKLLIHGDADATVPVEDAHRLFAAAKTTDDRSHKARLIEVPGADHVFGCPNPLPADAEAPADTRAMIDAVVGFAGACCV